MKVDNYKDFLAPLIYISILVIVFILSISFILEPIDLQIARHVFPENIELDARDIEEVSEEPIPSDFQWQGNPTDPKFISIPSISSNGFIENNGVNPKNEIAVPKNVYKAGWFDQSAKLGAKGLSIISGHLNGPSYGTEGIFANLDQLQEGQTFTVELGSGEILNYQVVEVSTYEYNEASKYLFSQKPEISSQLNLITCAGEFDDSARTFDERTIVVSKLI